MKAQAAYPKVYRWLDARLKAPWLYDAAACSLLAGYALQVLRRPLDRASWQHGRSALSRLGYVLEDHIRLKPDGGQWQSRLDWQGWEHVDAVSSDPRPVMGCFLHDDYHKYLRFLLRSRGIEAFGVVRRNYDPEADIHHHRFTFDTSQLAQASRHLASGGWLNIALDVPDQKPITFVHQGQPMQWSSGAFRLARKHGAWLIGCYVLPLPRWRCRVCFSEPIRLSEAASQPDVASHFAEFFSPVLLKNHYRRSPHYDFVFGKTCE